MLLRIFLGVLILLAILFEVALFQTQYEASSNNKDFAKRVLIIALIHATIFVVGFWVITGNLPKVG
jgi:hypothetical protein